MRLIDKSALVAEIEKWQDRITKGIFSIPLTGHDRADATFEYEVLGKVKDILNTLEVKEVDLNEEIANQYEANYEEYLTYEEFADIAKHFFELGMSVSNKEQKGEKV